MASKRAPEYAAQQEDSKKHHWQKHSQNQALAEEFIGHLVAEGPAEVVDKPLIWAVSSSDVS